MLLHVVDLEPTTIVASRPIGEAFRSGSISTKLGCPGHVRFPSDSDQTADIAGGPVRADFVAKVGDDDGEGRARLLMAGSANRCTGSGQLLPMPLGYAGPTQSTPVELAAVAPRVWRAA